MTIDSLKQALARKKEKNWDVIYGAIDLHRTAIKPDYDSKYTFQYYPFAKETLQLMCKSGIIKLIMYTCSYPEEIEKYLKAFAEDGINFEYVNENPAVLNNHLGDFSKKWHFDFLFDDKAGFMAEIDWEEIFYYFALDYLKTKCPQKSEALLDIVLKSKYIVGDPIKWVDGIVSNYESEYPTKEQATSVANAIRFAKNGIYGALTEPPKFEFGNDLPEEPINIEEDK